jgi:hypothetical protein
MTTRAIYVPVICVSFAWKVPDVMFTRHRLSLDTFKNTRIVKDATTLTRLTD